MPSQIRLFALNRLAISIQSDSFGNARALGIDTAFFRTAAKDARAEELFFRDFSSLVLSEGESQTTKEPESPEHHATFVYYESTKNELVNTG
jgi:hypothetical protein